MQIKPTRKLVLVLPDEPETVSAGGIVLSAQTKAPPRQGVVIAVGTEILDVKEGDHIMFAAYAGQTMRHEGIDYRVMPEADVIGILEV